MRGLSTLNALGKELFDIQWVYNCHGTYKFGIAMIPCHEEDEQSHFERCAIHVYGNGTQEENVAAIRRWVEPHGWRFIQVITPLNRRPAILFERRLMR